MKSHKKSFRHESLQDSESILKILAAVTEGLQKGKLVLSDTEEEIILNPQGLLQLRVTATQEDNRYQLGLKISWQQEVEPYRKKTNLQVSTD